MQIWRTKRQGNFLNFWKEEKQRSNNNVTRYSEQRYLEEELRRLKVEGSDDFRR